MIRIDIIMCRYIKFWKGYYCRWNPRMRPQDSVHLRHAQLLSLRDQLQSKVTAVWSVALSTRLKLLMYFEMIFKQISFQVFSSSIFLDCRWTV